MAHPSLQHLTALKDEGCSLVHVLGVGVANAMQRPEYMGTIDIASPIGDGLKEVSQPDRSLIGFDFHEVF